MSRWSPTVLPKARDPLDFSPITDMLRDRRAQRERERRDALEDEDRKLQRETVERQLLLQGAEPEEAYETRRDDETKEAALHAPMKLDVAAEDVGAPSFDTGPATFGRAAPVGPDLPVARVPLNGKQFVIDPRQQLRLQRARTATEYEARNEGESTGSYNAAIRAGVDPEEARRYAFGPKGLTVSERLRLQNDPNSGKPALIAQRGVQQMQLETYKWGKRMELQSRKERAGRNLLAARQHGDAALMKQYLAEYKGAKDELAMADRAAGFAMQMIPNDPIMAEMAKQDEALAPLIEDAERSLQAYFPGGGRQRLVEKVRGAGESNAQAQGGQRPTTDPRVPVSQDEWNEMLKEPGASAERLRKKYRIKG